MSTWSVDQHDRVAVATFTRPPRNLMSFAAMGELEEVLGGLAEREDVSVVVLTGGVPGYFVAHADLDDLIRLARGEDVDGDPTAWNRALALAESMPQPVVAAVNGQAWGGGCELSLACTLRVAASEAHRIGLVEAVLPDEGFLTHVLEWLGPIAVKPRRALAAAKRAVVDGLRLPFDEGLRLEGRLFVECQLDPEAVELEEELLRRYRESPPDERVRF